ncbi:glycosyltransferase family 2 protein [Aureimonas leprariae]|uniref:Glycosyltransferase n=1 Tax=Plantimonas leprariae TaxID=2615207 RepID=A0A7V7PQE6_9HYPH|nr:glycosyltransferase [Aureimonas leprariae]KAB0680292.1 glycosyltransferase [Aureimonas leprariae]
MAAKVSLTVCTKNGGERLGTCLDHIEAMDAPAGMELFLVDNGSDDGTSFERLHAFAARSRYDVRVRQTFVPGNSAGRNVALAEATGDIHIFVDDDCYADEGLVRNWLRVFASDPKLGFGSGRVWRHDPATSMSGCVEYPEIRYMPPGKFIWRGFVQGSNMAFRRECLEEIGRFDPRFGSGTPLAGEDWDMGLRASAAGWAGVYSPDAAVSHDHRRTDDNITERELYYYYGGGAIFAKHTFSRKGVRIFREFVRETGKLKSKPDFRDAMRKGYRDFLIHRGAAKAA